MLKKAAEHRFAVCIKNDDCGDLERRKVYEVLQDAKAEHEGHLRILDESGEDYLYPESYFVPIHLPRRAQEAPAIMI
ncbi:MAG: hypothetical protein C5B50_04100 [Verrucomicrobia bacterium]|nr:MAG: hypothetical protein C5B50_04100 [Verrucomicrobiota bacterium]